MKIILVSKCFLDIEQYVEFKMQVFPQRASLAGVESQDVMNNMCEIKQI